MRFVIGVDGGGTKTTAAVVGDDLCVLGAGTSGPSNYRSADRESSSRNIVDAATQALCVAQIPLERIDAICMCLAGFDTELDLPVPQCAITLLGYGGAVILENDVVGAWACATAGGPGIVAIAGTGATALGMNADGTFWRVDGWDYLLGDAGSGYRIGLAAIHEAMKMLDGRRQPTRLLDKLATFYGVDGALAMRRLADSGGLGKLRVAEFSRCVAEAADEGDHVAQDILRQAASEIANDIEAIVTQLAMKETAFPIGVVGSVFKSTSWVLDPLRMAIQCIAPQATLGAPRHPPEVGAAIVAQNRLADGDFSSWTLGTGARSIRRSVEISHLAKR
ncbi:MAG TPA: BadF/BadG/BcrA/BcrD ATPase family protein [Ktedonobacterales bacterium]|nr:BadF/BadG/BcrA/BcrD ATPase family protein [Ktedonobacterales bacterium]